MRNLRWVVIGLTFLMCGDVLAGNLGNRTNHSAEAIRSLHRSASKDVDAAVYNPAGTTFLKDGWHLGFGNQFIIKSDTLTNNGIDYAANDPVLLYPNISAVYSFGDFAASLHFGVPSGGGSKHFKDGHPVFTAYGGRVANIANSAVPGVASGATVDGPASVKGTSQFIGLTLAGAYAPTDWFSFSIGGRVTMGSMKTVGNATYKFELTETGTILADAFANDPTSAGYALSQPVNIAVNSDASAIGFSPLISMHFVPLEGLDLTVQYIHQTNMNFTRTYPDCPAYAELEDGSADISTNNDGICANEEGVRDVSRLLYELETEGFDKGTVRTDIPAQLSLGASYVVNDMVRVEGSFSYFFNKMAKWGVEPSPSSDNFGNPKGDLYTDGWETGLVVEVSVDDFLVSLGGMYAKMGSTHESLSFLFWNNDAVSVATGATWQINESMTATLGVTFARYLPTSSGDLRGTLAADAALAGAQELVDSATTAEETAAAEAAMQMAQTPFIIDYDWYALDIALGMTYSF